MKARHKTEIRGACCQRHWAKMVAPVFQPARSADWKIGVTERRFTNASFRNAGEILELAGCDLLTISPQLLGELKNSTAPVTRKLSPEFAARSDIQKLDLDGKKFRTQFDEEAMATDKTAEGIRLFHADPMKLEKYIAERL